MKTPDEIKRLKYCGAMYEWDGSCTGCPYERNDGECDGSMETDAIAYIQQFENAVEFYCNTTQMLDAKIAKLESRLAQVERERDAAVRDLTKAMALDGVEDCSFCKNIKKPYCHPCKFEWRGVCEENTGGGNK